MADIFISYASQDRSRVAPLANALESMEWSVWWDRTIPPGKTFVQVIKEAISAAKCVVVLWSHDSIESDWVQEEAGIGKQRNILIPAKIDPVELPLGFGLIQAADLTDWQAGVSHLGFDGLIDAIAAKIGPSPLAVKQAEEKQRLKDAQREAEEKQRQSDQKKRDEAAERQRLEKKRPLAEEKAKDDARRLDQKYRDRQVRSQAKAEPSPGSDSTASRKKGLAIGVVALIAVISIIGWLYYDKGTKLLDPTKAKTIPQSLTNSIGMKFVYIAPDTFTMGSPNDEPNRSSDETQHQVTLTQGFYMQTTEVTQGQWRQVMESNPSYFEKCGDDCPVETVSWNDVQDFIKKLNAREGIGKYRLPTEAEWEYAARAGTQTPFAFGRCLSTDQANYDGDNPLKGCPKGQYRKTTIKVGSFDPNAWGLYDMHGNVWEWCQDWYGEKYYADSPLNDPEGPSNGSYRVIRGGGWYGPARICRSAYRRRLVPGGRGYFLGFRLVLLPGQQG